VRPTYRSFPDLPEPVDDFRKLKVAARCTRSGKVGVPG
jgi:hypothetical protein